MSNYLDNTNNINENNLNSAGAPINNNDIYKRPTNLLNAFSIIQRIYVIESKTDEDLPKEYFTIEQTWDFFKVGLKSGFIESFIFITLLPFFQTIYPSFKYYFFQEKLTNIEKIFLQTISFLPIIISTVYLIYLSKYYKGNVTRKALLSLFSGRSFAFLLKGIAIYFIFQYLYYISYKNPNEVWDFLNFLKWVLDWFLPAEININITYNYFYIYIAPALKQTAIELLGTMFFFAVLPYITTFLKGFTKLNKIKKAQKFYEKY